MKKLLYWAPRVLSILYAVFLSLFISDIFCKGSRFWETILSLLIHLIPIIIIVSILMAAWRWEWVGAILFIGLAFFFLFQVRGQEDVTAYLGISGPLALTGVLFALNWIFREQLQTR